jgi:hypothetical protein
VPVALLLAACAYENEEDLFGSKTCDPQESTYSGMINPILAVNCTIPSCHDGSSPALPDWTVFENVQSSAQDIRERTGNRTMPPSRSGIVLSAEQIDDIACWVENGAQNN